MRRTDSFANPAHAEAYAKGYSDKQYAIDMMGWLVASQKFNNEVPAGTKFGSLLGYYYAEGELDALVDTRPERYTHKELPVPTMPADGIVVGF